MKLTRSLSASVLGSAPGGRPDTQGAPQIWEYVITCYLALPHLVVTRVVVLHRRRRHSEGPPPDRHLEHVSPPGAAPHLVRPPGLHTASLVEASQGSVVSLVESPVLDCGQGGQVSLEHHDVMTPSSLLPTFSTTRSRVVLALDSREVKASVGL